MSPGSNTSPTTGAASTSERLAAVNNLSLDALRIEWRQLYRSPPPRLSLDLMRRAVAYRIQEKAYGGLSLASRRTLKQLTVQLESAGHVTPEERQTVRSGARLVREWNGRTYTVSVTEYGFDYAGTVYSSLTKVARIITGAHWSGPRFFGLTSRKTEDREVAANA